MALLTRRIRKQGCFDCVELALRELHFAQHDISLGMTTSLSMTTWFNMTTSSNVTTLHDLTTLSVWQSTYFRCLGYSLPAITVYNDFHDEAPRQAR